MLVVLSENETSLLVWHTLLVGLIKLLNKTPLLVCPRLLVRRRLLVGLCNSYMALYEHPTYTVPQTTSWYCYNVLTIVWSTYDAHYVGWLFITCANTMMIVFMPTHTVWWLSYATVQRQMFFYNSVILIVKLGIQSRLYTTLYADIHRDIVTNIK